MRHEITKFSLLACLILSTPAAAVSHHDWSKASDISVALLGVAAIGAPLSNGGPAGPDWTGLLQTGGSVLMSGGAAQGLKLLVHEDRPDHSDDRSFPSGHTSVAFGAAIALERRYGWQIGLPATMLAVFVGTARVQARKHYWHDVVAGAAIGTGSAFLVAHPVSDNVQLVPWGEPRGGGLAASLRF